MRGDATVEETAEALRRTTRPRPLDPGVHDSAETASAEDARAEFLATISHEVRTPINAIVGYTDLLDLEVAGPLTPAQRTHLSRIRAASVHLLSLVNEVLDLRRAESGEIPVRREPACAGEAVDAAVAVVLPQAATRGITLDARCVGAGALHYRGDACRVRQMLVRLLVNAVKFTEPGGRVEIGCGPAAGAPLPGGNAAGVWVCFRVTDTGIGIDPGARERIFDPFVQLAPTRTRAHGGAGVGLALTRRLARRMDGEVTVETAPGGGSTFTLWLPAADPLLPREADPPFPPPAEGTAAFAAAGHALLGGLDELLAGFARRLRREGAGPGVESLPERQLRDHLAPLVGEIAVTLFALQDGDLAADPFASAPEILRACAAEHGRQRAALGWTEAHLSREYDILADELLAALPRDRGGDGGVAAAIRCRLERARCESMFALRTLPH